MSYRLILIDVSQDGRFLPISCNKFYFSISRSRCKYEYTQKISSCFSYTICIIYWCLGSWGAWCLPWWWDWWRSCLLPWCGRVWRGLTRTGWIRGKGWMFYFSSWRGRWSWWRCWWISDSIYQVFPVFVIKSKVCPQLQWAISIYCWYNERIFFQ